ncbi:MAG: NnrU family protein [Paracoccus sp. (in: a-proteobacteria)]|nr:NnrU family protein [Paracoccus sp. (in: a-proteobacteria)]
MSGWGEYILAFAAFLGSHVIPARPGLRGGLIAALGRRGYIAAYSLLSLGLLYWLIVAAGRAPVVPLWDQAIWQRWLVNLAMLLAVLAATCAPGLSGLMRAFALWAGAHLMANGDLAHVLFFGLLLAYALAGMARQGRPAWRVTPLRLGLAVVIWAALFWLHPYVIGVSPAP